MKIKIVQVKGKSPEERRQLIEDTQNLNEFVQCKGSVYFETKEEGHKNVYKNHTTELIKIEVTSFYADIYFVQGETPIKELTQQRQNLETHNRSTTSVLENKDKIVEGGREHEIVRKPVTQTQSDGRGVNQSGSSSSGGFNFKKVTPDQLAYCQSLADELGEKVTLNPEMASSVVSKMIKQLNKKKYSRR